MHVGMHMCAWVGVCMYVSGVRMCVYAPVWVHAHVCAMCMHMCGSKGNLQESVLAFHHMHAGDYMWVIKPGSKPPYSLSPLDGPGF